MVGGAHPTFSLLGTRKEKKTAMTTDESHVEEMVAKVKAIAQGPHGALFARVLETFYEQTGAEYFSAQDLQDIEEGIAEIRQGKCLTLEEYRQGKRL
jgi:hypothetical protein